MIHKLHIKNFKLIKDNSFDFKPLTIITGTNSCGKSSILQTLCFFINTNILNIEKSMYIQNCRRKNKISIWKNKTSIKVEILFFYKP